MNERLKDARKALHLTQREFAERIGVKDNAISRIESGNRNLTDQMLLAICREYGINEEWLRTGIGAMFIENDGTLLASLAVEYGLDNLDTKILDVYLKLSDDRRRVVKEFVCDIARRVEAEHVAQFHSDIVNEIMHANLSPSIENNIVEGITAAKQEIFGVNEDEEDFQRIASPITLPSSAAIPGTSVAEVPRELTEEEAVALVRARYSAAKRGLPLSTISEK